MSLLSPAVARRSPARPARLLLVATALAALFVALVGPARPAHADNFRFWGYYELVNGAWAFAQTGPADTKPAEGSVEGWRFAVDDGTGKRFPRATPTFASVCAGTTTEPGKKRVAVIVDPGRDVDGDGTGAAPPPVAKCASVTDTASGAEVLAAVATVRTGDKGLVCGINGYPASGCGGAVATLTDAQKAPDTTVSIAPATATPTATATAAPATTGPVTTPLTTSPSSSPWGIWVGLLVVLAVAVLLAWSVSRRKKSGV